MARIHLPLADWLVHLRGGIERELTNEPGLPPHLNPTWMKQLKEQLGIVNYYYYTDRNLNLYVCLDFVSEQSAVMFRLKYQ